MLRYEREGRKREKKGERERRREKERKGERKKEGGREEEGLPSLSGAVLAAPWSAQQGHHGVAHLTKLTTT